jgi:hypothetical protein
MLSACDESVKVLVAHGRARRRGQIRHDILIRVPLEQVPELALGLVRGRVEDEDVVANARPARRALGGVCFDGSLERARERVAPAMSPRTKYTTMSKVVA